ncbi:cytochrome-c peroxidase [Hymenobacter sp. 5317J-9]|uniref:cytochrome-c peroxidase n=1 Tax=Hymenobacter sp. 5317J-9 TaxID=2932250 RepID=UPI001FD6D96F|nr:cytochrome-c peroxidase [Hymenobacter sp. 5317J-9]UOQ99024.1 cytochrome-c peroxidase [Hymenobacter sp. 5317J-9]
MAASLLPRVASMLAAATLLLAVACHKESENATPSNDDLSVLGALPLSAPAPADNPGTPAKIALGRALFWDPVLSGGKDVSCASCHHPANGYADAIDLAIGVNGQGLGTARRFRQPNTIPFTKRNTPTVLNTAFNGLANNGTYDPTRAAMFWDSRAQSLEAQSVQPIAALEEMRGTACSESAALDTAVARLRRIPAYTTMFGAAFAEPVPVTATNIGKALASFERTLLATDAPFDKYLRGDKTALSAQQVQGLNAFISSGCAKCHSGPMLSDYQLHVLGVPDNPKNAASDAGANNSYAFRTASLRNVALTAPYMHSGALPNLGAVLAFYAPPPGAPPTANPRVAPGQRDPLFPTRVNDPQAIIAFLQSLTASSFDRSVPATVPSGLAVGGNIQ